MSRKSHLRRLSVLVTAQTLYNLERLRQMGELQDMGRVVDKLTREKMVSLHTQTPVQSGHTPQIDLEEWTSVWEGSADGYADGELVYDTWKCGSCGYIIDTDDTDLLPDFCPVCGKAMTQRGRNIQMMRLGGSCDMLNMKMV
ncbi:MAG: hypothetical protein MR999_02090 [Flintibacter sp.]|uniref:rubredoxin-like domain-containing protein n=1 Tax=Flintibacter sp. TaxID=1918624 RepID=UPI002D7EDB64|nr:hypothetical protein [Flintibacter sp.]MCI7158204.1 hypothetical protein [Flintibacter sp.]